MERKVDVVVIGSGSAGLAAFSVVRSSTENCLLVNGGELGTTCARVGCMPSKIAIQLADNLYHPKAYQRYGITGGDALALDQEEALEYIRDLRDEFVFDVLESSTDDLGEDMLLEGYAEFIDKNTIQVGDLTLHADKFIIATGSTPNIPKPWQAFGDKILTTDAIFELATLPTSVAVIGLGVIGLELGQMLHRLGVHVTGIEQSDAVAHVADPVARKITNEAFAKEFPIWLGHPAEIAAQGDQLQVTAGAQSIVVDRVFATLGRAPNLAGLGLSKLGVALDEKGMPPVDLHTMQIADLPIFMAGDVAGHRPILHEANDEGRIAGYNATHEVTPFKRKTPLMITFTDPNIVMVGQAYDQLDTDAVVIGQVRMAPIGRARILGSNRGVIRVYVEKASGRLLGMTMIGVRGEHIGHLMAWAIQQSMTVADILKMPFYHPVIEEALQAALYDVYKQLPDAQALVSMERL